MHLYFSLFVYAFIEHVFLQLVTYEAQIRSTIWHRYGNLFEIQDTIWLLCLHRSYVRKSTKESLVQFKTSVRTLYNSQQIKYIFTKLLPNAHCRKRDTTTKTAGMERPRTIVGMERPRPSGWNYRQDWKNQNRPP